MFTSFQRHLKFEEEVFIQAKNAMSQMNLPKIPDPPRNAHIIERNLEVASWYKPAVKKLPSVRHDDNIGEDSLSSQSVYQLDIQDKVFLESLIPFWRYLPFETIEVDILLKPTYAILFKAIFEVKKKQVQNSTLKMMDEN